MSFYDGNILLSECEQESGLGINYIVGVVDGAGLDLPNGTKAGLLQDIVRQYLKDHPQELRRKAADIVVEALNSDPDLARHLLDKHGLAERAKERSGE